MSTPRTDRVIKNCNGWHHVPVEFAREQEERIAQLERELSAAKSALKEADKLLHAFEAAQRPHGSDRFGNACECDHCQAWDQLVEVLPVIDNVLNDGPLPAPNKEQSNHK